MVYPITVHVNGYQISRYQDRTIDIVHKGTGKVKSFPAAMCQAVAEVVNGVMRGELEGSYLDALYNMG